MNPKKLDPLLYIHVPMSSDPSIGSMNKYANVFKNGVGVGVGVTVGVGVGVSVGVAVGVDVGVGVTVGVGVAVGVGVGDIVGVGVGVGVGSNVTGGGAGKQQKSLSTIDSKIDINKTSLKGKMTVPCVV